VCGLHVDRVCGVRRYECRSCEAGRTSPTATASPASSPGTPGRDCAHRTSCAQWPRRTTFPHRYAPRPPGPTPSSAAASSASQRGTPEPAHHRHHRPPRGMKFAIGVAEDGLLVGVATVGRPVARHLDDGQTVEVTRPCTLGAANANSMLYGAAWRATRAMGYRRLITYTQQGESGASLRAAGLRPMARLRARSGWDAPSRGRCSHGVDGVERIRWEIESAVVRGCAA
jgi:hypothetical protein